ncbi:MAG: hypothetical protein KDJ52_22260 [Anaerolineae bacterium]|nr:hypothetical protein [Anaerolineae bacterium]
MKKGGAVQPSIPNQRRFIFFSFIINTEIRLKPTHFITPCGHDEADT